MAFFDIFGRNLIIFDPHKSIYNFTTHGSGEFYRDPISHLYRFLKYLLDPISFKIILLPIPFLKYIINVLLKMVMGEIYHYTIY
jgi:hypothetical protein